MSPALPTAPQLPRAAGEFLPHRPPMQLVDRLLAAANGSGSGETTVAAGCPLLGADGRLEKVALIELLAQCYAAVQGYIDQCAGRPPGRGFLVGIRKAQLYAPARIDDRLLVAVRTVARVDTFVMVEGEVRCDDRLLASALFKLWLPVEAS